jgi:ABC-type sugar transport system ATPase subunit
MLICDRIIVMRGGAIVAERNVSESSEQEITQIVTDSASTP